MSFLARMVGGGTPISQQNEQQSRRDTVEKLCNRLMLSSLLEDRRASARTIHSSTKQLRSVQC